MDEGVLFLERELEFFPPQDAADLVEYLVRRRMLNEARQNRFHDPSGGPRIRQERRDANARVQHHLKHDDIFLFHPQSLCH